jgi:hypothetical protein
VPDPILTRREIGVWVIAFLFVASLLVLTQFTSEDADSTLYAGLSARLATEPFSRWIAPEWWGLWPRIGNTGLYRDHPIGGFVVPALLGRLGIPGEQAAYIVGVAAGWLAIVLISQIVGRLTTRRDARAALILLQIMPVAFVFRIRANQEYAMLICLIVTILGVDRVRRNWWGVASIVAGLGAALFIKGAFVTLTMAGAATWALINPPKTPGSRWRPVVGGIAALGALALLAAGYDAWYRQITGESFWSEYWGIQLSQVELSTPLSGAVTFLQHAGFYLVRLLWHPAPWSLALVGAGWLRRTELRALVTRHPVPAVRGLIFALAYACVLMLMLSPSSRVAERYIFFGTYAIAAAGVVVMCRTWPRVARTVAEWDSRIPALPVVVWLSLMLLRLGVGPWIPRLFMKDL